MLVLVKRSTLQSSFTYLSRRVKVWSCSVQGLYKCNKHQLNRMKSKISCLVMLKRTAACLYSIHVCELQSVADSWRRINWMPGLPVNVHSVVIMHTDRETLIHIHVNTMYVCACVCMRKFCSALCTYRTERQLQTWLKIVISSTFGPWGFK